MVVDTAATQQAGISEYHGRDTEVACDFDERAKSEQSHKSTIEEALPLNVRSCMCRARLGHGRRVRASIRGQLHRCLGWLRVPASIPCGHAIPSLTVHLMQDVPSNARGVPRRASAQPRAVALSVAAAGPTARSSGIAAMALKVPEVTVYFWIVKLLTTAMGESTTDYLVFQIDPYVAVGLGFAGLAVSLVLQLLARRYVPWIYWLTVVMVAVFGTMAADVLHVVLGIPYTVSTIAFASALVLVFAAWYAVERDLSIHTIFSGRRELFYWATVMATFALGTAAGDLAASTLGLGYFASAVVFAVLFALPALAYWRLHLHPILAFWCAYVITRPLGATVADWLGKPQLGGLGLGDGHIAVVLGVLIIACVAYLTVSRIDVSPAVRIVHASGHARGSARTPNRT